MAEIKITKKKIIRPWIVAALIIAAIIMYLVFSDAKEEKDELSLLLQSEAFMNIKQEVSWSEFHILYLV